MYWILPLCTLVNRNSRMNRKTDSSSRQNNKMKTVFGNYIVKCVGITSSGQFHYHLNFFCERRRVGTDGPFLDAIWYVIFILDTFRGIQYSLQENYFSEFRDYHSSRSFIASEDYLRTYSKMKWQYLWFFW